MTPEPGLFWTMGDADLDGRTDLLRQGETTIESYESVDSFSLPLNQVWVETLRAQASPMNAIISDLDGDSVREITVDDDYRVCISVFENVANNEYALSTCLPSGPGVACGLAQTMDMDRDGKPELAVGQDVGVVIFFEAVADDSLVRRAVRRLCPSPTHAALVIGLAAAPDIDHDGRTELVAVCCAYQQSITTISVLESPTNDSFAVVWSVDVPGNGLTWSAAVGDVDGDSVPEFVANDGRGVHLFRCTGNDQYEQFWTAYTGSGEATLYDVNADGKAELLYNSEGQVIIREWLPVGVEERWSEKLRQMEILPSVVRSRAVVRVSGLPPSAEVEVVDATGRVVASGPSGASSFVLGTLDLEAGAYFIRIRVGNQAIVRKVLVVD